MEGAVERKVGRAGAAVEGAGVEMEREVAPAHCTTQNCIC